MLDFHTIDPTKKPKLRIGMDLDGCYYWFERAWYYAAVAQGVIDPRMWRFQAARTWAFYEAYGVDLTTFLAVCNRAADDGTLWAHPPMEGTRETWRRLHRDGHELHVLTDRSFGTHPLVSEVATRMWLHFNDLPYASLTFTADKTVVQVDIMLEDKVENYDALDAVGVEVWLINRLYNEDGDGVTRRRVYTHAEFERRVDAMVERRWRAENEATEAVAS